MWALVLGALRIASYVLTGVGVLELTDKFVKPEVPAAVYPEPASPGLKPFKLIWILSAAIAAFMLLKFIGKKLNIKLLK